MHSLANLANVAFLCGRPRDAATLHEQALVLVRAQGNAPGLGVALINAAEVQAFLGRHAEALRQLEEALASPAVREDVLLRLAAYRLMGAIWSQKAEYQRAEECLSEARSSLGSTGVPAEWVAELELEEALLLSRSGALARCKNSAIRALGNARDAGAELTAMQLELLLLSLGHDLASMESTPDSSLLERARKHHHPQLVAAALLFSAGDRGTPDLDARRQLAREALSLVESMEAPMLVAEARLTLAGLEENGQASAEVSSHVHAALEIAERFGYPELEWRAHWAIARGHAENGRPHRALAWYRSCLRVIRTCVERIGDAASQRRYLEGPLQSRVLHEFRCMLRSEN